MKIKEIKIAWNSCEIATGVHFQACITIECGDEAPEQAYARAIATMRNCLIAEGAQFDAAVVPEVG